MGGLISTVRYATLTALLVVAMGYSRPFKVMPHLNLRFINFAGGKPLILDSANYFNAFNQKFEVSMLKFYVGQIRLTSTKGKDYILPGYFLINEDDPASKEIAMSNLKAGRFDSLEFIIGVDSLHNCSGVQSGSLDPALGMFWAWNTGYIFLKLEGKSPASMISGHTIEYHIGGYKNPNSAIRRITLPVDLAMDNASKEIRIKVDIMQLLTGKNQIDFSKLPSITDFHNSTLIADNYAGMFSILP